MKMDWLEWLKAEGFYDQEDPAGRQAFEKLRKAQKDFEPGSSDVIRSLGLTKTSNVPVGLLVDLVCRVGLQAHYETELVAAILLRQLRLQQDRIDALEKRIPPE